MTVNVVGDVALTTSRCEITAIQNSRADDTANQHSTKNSLSSCVLNDRVGVTRIGVG